jgi:PAS domain S-box-containing protein
MTRIKPEYRVLMERYPTYSRLIVPLKAQGQIIGTLELTRTQPGRPYTIIEQAFLQDLADRAGLAISNARLYSALQQELTERKQAEAALTRSQAMLNFAQQLGNLGSFVCELETRRILWSDQLYRITGFEPGEVKPTIKLAFSLIHPSSQRLLRALFREAFEQGHSQQEIPLVLRSGELRQVFIRTNVFYNAEGKPVSWVGTVLDITQSKKTEEALRRSEERYRSLVLASAQIIWIGKSEGRRAIEVTEMSDGWERLTGHPCQAVLGTGYLRLIHPADFPRVRAQWEQAVLKGLSFEMEHRIRCADGHYIYFQTRSVPIMDSNRKVQEWVGTMSDITARKQAEQALQESEERFRRLSEAAFEGIGISAEGRLLDANGRLAEMFGYELAEVIGKPVLDFVAPESVETVRKSLQFGAENAYEHLAIRKDGTFFPVEAQSKSLPFKGAMVRVTALRDITQRRRLEEQLRQSQKMESIGQLAGGIAHDFNNLLTIIISYSEILEYLPSDSIEEHLEEIEQIKEAALRAATLTRQLLAFSRRAQVDMRVLNLNTIISDLLKMLERLIGEDIELTTVLAANLGKVKADGGQLEQMIMNLVINARDAMPQGGKLTVETANIYLDAAYARQHYEVQPGWYVMLAVSDTGTGMSAETQSRIFEPFFTTKEQGKGTGLGMAMVHGIIKQSGGHIWIYSEMGHGTTFKIYLPLVEEGESMQLPFHPAFATTTGSETVLLVEDDEVVRQLVREILEKQGYRVLEAGCEDAVVVSDHYTGPIALLLTDVVMPKLNGRELAERLLVTRPDLKVLYMSGYTDTVMLHHGLMAEEVAFLQKPFTPGGLAQKVRAVLDK